MSEANPRTTAKIAGHPIHPMLVPFPIAFCVGALVTDVAYSQTTNPMWANFSTWLLVGGLAMAALAAVAGLTDFLGSRQIRALRPAWLHMLLNVGAVLLSAFNLLVHFRDGAAGVVPTGLTISLIVTVLLVLSGWLGGDLVYKRRVGVAD